MTISIRYKALKLKRELFIGASQLWWMSGFLVTLGAGVRQKWEVHGFAGYQF